MYIQSNAQNISALSTDEDVFTNPRPLTQRLWRYSPKPGRNHVVFFGFRQQQIHTHGYPISIPNCLQLNYLGRQSRLKVGYFPTDQTLTSFNADAA